jgi:hypothetical protein
MVLNPCIHHSAQTFVVSDGLLPTAVLLKFVCLLLNQYQQLNHYLLLALQNGIEISGKSIIAINLIILRHGRCGLVNGQLIDPR